MSERPWRRPAAALALAAALAAGAAGLITWCRADIGPASGLNQVAAGGKNHAEMSGEKPDDPSGSIPVTRSVETQVAVEKGARSGGDAGVGDTNGRDASRPIESAVVRLIRSTDEADRSLLAEVERLREGAPSEAVQALLALRRSGAGREQLERFIAGRLGSPLALRLAARRWLNAVAPVVDAAPASPAVPSSFGRGGGARRVQQIERRR